MSEGRIEFNANYLELVKNLTAISPGIVFCKEEGKVIINRTNKGRSIFFKVSAPENYFSFTGDKIAFYNFAEFFGLMGAFGVSSLEQKENKIVIESNIGKINYVLSSPETLAKSPSKINISDPDIVFNLASDILGEMKKINTLLNAKMANISCVDKSITVKLFNSSHENSFDKQFTPESFVDGVTDFDFAIYSEIISKLPAGVNYKVSLFKKGYVFFSFENQGIEFIAVTGRVKKVGADEQQPEGNEGE